MPVPCKASTYFVKVDSIVFQSKVASSGNSSKSKMLEDDYYDNMLS